MKTCHPHQPKEYSESYRTLGRVRQIDYAWETVLHQVFPNDTDESNALSPTFGNASYLDFDQIQNGPLPEQGTMALLRILCALSHVVGLEYAPLLPSLALVSLSFQSESYAYAQLREMAHNSSSYFAVSPVEHVAWCRAFMDILTRLHPQTASTIAAVMQNDVALQGLDPIFKQFFMPILKFEHVLRIMDIYTLEGYKVLFRFGVALLCLFKKDDKVRMCNVWGGVCVVCYSSVLTLCSLHSLLLQDAQAATIEDFWMQLRSYTHDATKFSMDTLVRKAYGYHGSRARKRMRFPRRHILARIIRLEQEKVADQLEFEPIQEPTRPLPLVPNESALLLNKADIRSNLAAWLPLSLRLATLELVFSTNVHGRTLERFYSHVSDFKHTVTVVQILDRPDAVVGMFASQAWRSSSQVYGDGECFLFRASPDAQCFKWRPASGSGHHQEQDDDKSVALLEQFMVGRPNFISMGGNEDGSCGLRLNEDLTRGESAAAVGFGNEGPLIEGLSVFNVGLVEVYRLKQLGGNFSFDEG